MEPIIDHLQITVKDMSVAVPFYDKLLPLLGFDLQRKVSAVIEAHECHVVEYIHPRLAFCHRLAFKAASRAEVDRLHGELKGIGATIVSAPREYPEYNPPSTYALFFKDLEGIKYEIVCYEESA